jgi:hypothetical protein
MGRKKTVGRRFKGYSTITPTAITNTAVLTTTDPESPAKNLRSNVDQNPDFLVLDGEEEPENVIRTLQEYVLQDDNEPETTLDGRDRRIAIAFAFAQLGAPYETLENPWSKRGCINCISAVIKRNLNLPSHTETTQIFRDYLDCRDAGVKYKGDWSIKVGNTLGRPTILTINSTEAQILADTQEEGFSLSLSWHVINQHRQEAGLPSVTRSAVNGLLTRLKPKLSRIQKVSQGSRDINSPWSIARFFVFDAIFDKIGWVG